MENNYSNFDEVGNTGLKALGGFISEDFITELNGSSAVRIYREMSNNDPIVGAILRAIEMLIRNVEYRVNPGTPDSKGAEVAEFIQSCFDDMTDPFNETLNEILSMLTYGFSVHEIVYKRRNGLDKNKNSSSKHTDGKIGWSKLPIRSQETIVDYGGWVFEENGDLIAVEQTAPPRYKKVVIPNEKILLFRPSRHKNNPEGKSILRNAYRPWYFKKNIENVEGIGIERDLAGLPVIYCPADVLKNDASASVRALKTKLENIVTNIRRDEQEGVLMPMMYDENNNKMFSLELLSTGGSRQFDTDKIVNRYDQRIAMTVLADFILLGHNAVGSFALASSKTKIFASAMGAWLTAISDIFNRQAIPRLMELNGLDLQHTPELVFGDIESVDLTELGDFITKLSSAGMPLFPDDNLENFVREQANFPAKTE